MIINWRDNMKLNKSFKIIFALIALLIVVSLVGCAQNSASEGKTQSTKPREGGTLNVAFSAEPDTLDWAYSGATSTKLIGWHIFESLFSLDKNYKVRPMIAKGYEVSENGTTYKIKLREDVNFHNGSTVTADDVVASIQRWKKVSSVGKHADKYIKQVRKVDEHTIELKLKEKYTSLLSDMASPKSALIIIPEKIAEKAGEQPLDPEQLIGTGPFKFNKWERGNKIVLTKFEDYSTRNEDWGGLSGKKVAYFDTINFKIVKDPQTMINGVKTGIYDYAQSIPPDLYRVIESNPKINPVTYINGYSILTLDQSEPPFNDVKVRQALNHALNKKTIAKAAYGNEKFYSFDGALFSPKQKALHTKKGTDNYLAYNKEKAKRLLKESNYDGGTIKIMYANNYEDFAKISEIVKQQMEEVGFTVELVPYEWATYLEKWSEPGNWDLVTIGWATLFSPNQLGMLSLDSSSSGWYNSERWAKLLERWGHAETEEKKNKILAKMNQTVYDELPFIKIVNEKTLDIMSSKIEGYTSWIGLRFWNTWKSE